MAIRELPRPTTRKSRKSAAEPPAPAPSFIHGRHGTSGFVAAAQAHSTAAPSTKKLLRPQAWQQFSWSYYDKVPEIKRAFNYLADIISRVHLYPAKLPTQAERRQTPTVAPPQVTTNSQAVEVFERMAPSGDYSKLLRRNSIQFFVPGEAWAVGWKERPESGQPEEWGIFSMDELKQENKAVYLLDGPGGNKYRTIDTTAGDAFIRVWQEDDRYSQKADSPMSVLLGVAETLLILERAVRAIGRSRIVQSGILALANEMMPSPAATGDENSDAPDTSIPFLEQLMEAINRGIEDEGDPSATSPIFMYGDAEVMEKFPRHIKLERDFDDVLGTMIDQVIRRLAIGLPLPPEALLGTGGIAGWGAWSVDQATFSLHAEPMLDRILANWNRAIFQPRLQAMGVVDWQRYAIAADYSHLIVHPNRTRDLLDAAKDNVASRASARAVLSLKESDAPTFEEMAEDAFITRAALDPDMTVAFLKSKGIDLTDTILDLNDRKQSAIAENMEDRGTIRPGEQPDSPINNAGKQPKARTRKGTTPPTGRSELAASGMVDPLLPRIDGAVSMAIAAAASKAGARLRSHAKKNRATLAVMEGVPNSLVASTVGREKIADLGLTDTDLIMGAFDDLQAQLMTWGQTAETSAVIASIAAQEALNVIHSPSSAPRDLMMYIASALPAPEPPVESAAD